jgi:hypothetical protein
MWSWKHEQPDGLELMDAWNLAKEGIMRRRAEHWLAEQEVALLEAIYQLESPPEREDPRQSIRLEVQTVRVVKSRLRRDPSQADGTITG